MWKAQYSLSEAFHISEGTYSFQTQQSIFCIFASFFTFYQILSFTYTGKEAERKITGLVFT
jgi:hypothetical protein